MFKGPWTCAHLEFCTKRPATHIKIKFFKPLNWQKERGYFFLPYNVHIRGENVGLGPIGFNPVVLMWGNTHMVARHQVRR